MKNSLLILFITLTTLTYSCSNKILFTTNKTVPAARGYVKLSTDKNNNYTINLKLTNLAEVERLLENKNTYVVWIQTKDIYAINIGQIQSKTGTFNNNLSADFQTISALKPIRVFITAEEEGSVTTPGSLLVLTTETF